MKEAKFYTKDFYCACVLRVMGFPLINIEKQSMGFSNFVFDDKDHKAKLIVNRFWNRDLKVDARLFVESINELKTRLHTH